MYAHETHVSVHTCMHTRHMCLFMYFFDCVNVCMRMYLVRYARAHTYHTNTTHIPHIYHTHTTHTPLYRSTPQLFAYMFVCIHIHVYSLKRIHIHVHVHVFSTHIYRLIDLLSLLGVIKKNNARNSRHENQHHWRHFVGEFEQCTERHDEDDGIHRGHYHLLCVCVCMCVYMCVCVCM
jgi:hypothetical protein